LVAKCIKQHTKLIEDDMVEGEIGTMEEDEGLLVFRFVAAAAATFFPKFPGGGGGGGFGGAAMP
jgi:hypothetical protein